MLLQQLRYIPMEFSNLGSERSGAGPQVAFLKHKGASPAQREAPVDTSTYLAVVCHVANLISGSLNGGFPFARPATATVAVGPADICHGEFVRSDCRQGVNVNT